MSHCKTTCNDHSHIALIFFGDSDIARWPEHLFPSLDLTTKKNLNHHRIDVTTFNFSKSGAIMENLSKQITKASHELTGKNERFDEMIFIGCAGENDVSNGIPIDTTMEFFNEAMKSINSFFDHHSSPKQPYVLFMGPKVEPWMDSSELESRNGYFQLSARLKQACRALSASASICSDQCRNPHYGSQSRIEKHANESEISCKRDHEGHFVHYVDCLAMFCTLETMGLSVVGGQALADTKYFNEDGLHLSDEGYLVWKEEVVNLIEGIVCGEKCGESLDNTHRPIDL